MDTLGWDHQRGGGAAVRGELGRSVGKGHDDTDGSDEAVAAAGEGLNEAGVFGRVAKGFADFIDGGAEGVVEVDDGIFAPEAGLEIFPGYDLAGLLEQGRKDFKRLALQLDAEAGFPELACLDINLVQPKTEPRVSNLARHSYPNPRLLEFTTCTVR